MYSWLTAPPPYTYEQKSDALGVTYAFIGPGFSPWCNEIRPIQLLNDWALRCLSEQGNDTPEDQARKVLFFLNLAFEQGKQARSRELAELLGVKQESR